MDPAPLTRSSFGLYKGARPFRKMPTNKYAPLVPVPKIDPEEIKVSLKNIPQETLERLAKELPGLTRLFVTRSNKAYQDYLTGKTVLHNARETKNVQIIKRLEPEVAQLRKTYESERYNAEIRILNYVATKLAIPSNP